MESKTQAMALPLKVVIDGYLVDEVWAAYRQGERTYRGMCLPDGLELGDELPFRILSLEASAGEETAGQHLSQSEVNDYLREQKFSRSCSEEVLGKMLDWAGEFYEIEMRQGTKYASTATGAEFAFTLDDSDNVELQSVTLRERMPPELR